MVSSLSECKNNKFPVNGIHKTIFLTEIQGPDKMSRKTLSLLVEYILWLTISSTSARTHARTINITIYLIAEYVTHRATHARYEGEAHARRSASAVLYHPKYCSFFSKLWSISQIFLRVVLTNKPRRHLKHQRSEDRRRERQIYQFGYTFYKWLPSWQTTHLLPVVRCGW